MRLQRFLVCLRLFISLFRSLWCLSSESLVPLVAITCRSGLPLLNKWRRAGVVIKQRCRRDKRQDRGERETHLHFRGWDGSLGWKRTKTTSLDTNVMSSERLRLIQNQLIGMFLNWNMVLIRACCACKTCWLLRWRENMVSMKNMISWRASDKQCSSPLQTQVPLIKIGRRARASAAPRWKQHQH